MKINAKMMKVYVFAALAWGSTISGVTGQDAPPDRQTNLFFHGSQDYVEVEGNPALSPGADSYTWEFWARTADEATGWGLPIEYPGGNRYYVGYQAASGWNFVLGSGGVRTDTNADNWISRITGRWLFVQAVLDVDNLTQTLRVYDWENDAWEEASVTPGEGPNNNSGSLYIPSSPNRFPYQGNLREMRFWRTVRTQADAMADMLSPLIGDEENLVAYWPMNEGEGDTVFDQTEGMNHGTILGSPRWESGWEFVFEPIEAPFALDFGEGPTQDDGERLLRNFPLDYVLKRDSLGYAGTGNGATSTALAVVENYLNRQNFVLETNFAVNRFGGAGRTRVGVAALGGPHSTAQRFDSLTDTGFYGFAWVPAGESGVSTLEIREGFGSVPIIAEEWNGASPLNREAPSSGEGEGVVYFEGFEDLAAANEAWTTGGSPDIWELGEPVDGPGSAYAGQNAAGTGLGPSGKYGTNTDAWLRSPVIDLTGLAGPLALSFWEYVDVDAEFDEEGFFHLTTVNVLDQNLNFIAEVSRDAAQLNDWRLRQIQMPEEALGNRVVLEFRLQSDQFGGNVFDGWFIDNVGVSGFQPMEFNLVAEGNYLRTGALELSVSLTDENGFSQTVTTSVANPITGNLFGIGGQLQAGDQGRWEFAFDDFSMELGTWSLPLTFGPASYAFGSGEGLGGGGNFFQNVPEDWSVGAESLFLAPVAADVQNSLAVGQVGNLGERDTFYTRLTMTLVGLDSTPADNSVGLVLFGDEDPAVFDSDNDGTFYSLQWMPNPSDGSRLVFRQGMAGPIVAEVGFSELANPPAAPSAEDPQAGVGHTYTFEFTGTYTSSGELAFIGQLSDGNEGRAVLSGTMASPPTGNHFGFGARHGLAGDPVWQFHRFDWFNTQPVAMPIDYAFGSGAGRDSDENFHKSGMRANDWSLENDSLRISREFLSGASSEPVSAMINALDYRRGQDFSVRSSVVATIADERPVFLRFDGSEDYIRVSESPAVMPMGDDYTWEFWARVSPGAGGWNIPVEYPDGDRYFVGFNNNNGWNFALTSNGSRTDTWRDRYLVPAKGRWVFVQAVLDRQNTQQILRVFDPLEDIWQEARVVPGLGVTEGFGDLFIPSQASRFQGDLREMRFWRDARTQADAESDMYQPLQGFEENLAAYWPMTEGTGQTVTDQSVNGNTGFFVGEPSWTSFEGLGAPTDISLAQFGPFVRFDGQGDHAVVAEDPVLTPNEDSYSWEFWARLDPAATGWNLPVEYRGGNRYYVGFLAGRGWNFVVAAGARTDTNGDRYIGNLPGGWVFVQAVLDRENQQQILRVYDPLEDVWHLAQVTPNSGPNVNTGVLHLPSTVFPYQGDLQEVRFWRKARSQEEAIGDMYQSLRGDETGLTGYWPMNEGFGSTMHDLSENGNHATFRGSPEWITGGGLQKSTSLGIVALGGGGLQGTGSQFVERSFRLDWVPAANKDGGELLLSSPMGGTGAGRSLARADFSQFSNAPVFENGMTYTFELSGFHQGNGSLSLVGTLRDEQGREVEVIHHVQDPSSFLPDSWFGVAGRLPESATRLDWQNFAAGSPMQLGIEAPDFGIQRYADWLAQNFTPTEQADPSISDRLASPMGDGIANLLKYALGFDPWSLVKRGDLTRMEMNNGKLRLTYVERYQAYDIEYVPQASETLTAWNGDVIEVARVAHPDMADFDLVTVEADIPDEASQAFLRLLVQERP